MVKYKFYKNLFRNFELHASENKLFVQSYCNSSIIVWYDDEDEPFEKLLNTLGITDLYPAVLREHANALNNIAVKYLLGEEVDKTILGQRQYATVHRCKLQKLTIKDKVLPVRYVGAVICNEVHKKQHPKILWFDEKCIIFIKNIEIDAKYDCMINQYYKTKIEGKMILSKLCMECTYFFHNNRVLRLFASSSLRELDVQDVSSISITKNGIYMHELADDLRTIETPKPKNPKIKFVTSDYIGSHAVLGQLTLRLLGVVKNHKKKRPGEFNQFVLGCSDNYDYYESVCVLKTGMSDEQLLELNKLVKNKLQENKPSNFSITEPCDLFVTGKIFLNIICNDIIDNNGQIQIKMPRFINIGLEETTKKEICSMKSKQSSQF